MAQLNPKLWNNNNNKLLPEIRDKLLQIKERFIEGLNEKNIPLTILDTRIVGSNAAYNYNENSDLDLHIIVDDNEDNKLRLIYNYYKSSFNDKYSIKLKGINVEVYIEDYRTSAISNGVYSLDENKWLKMPEIIEKPEVDINDASQYMINQYKNVLLMNNKEEAQKLVDTLYANRQRSLALEGEYGVDNLIFKQFRNEGWLQDLKDLIIKGDSYELSLENLGARLIEDYLDPEAKFYDYGTDKVDEYNPKNLFTLDRTGMSFYDNFLNDEDLRYMQKNKSLDGEIIYMTPGEYFQKSAKIKGLDPERLYNAIIKDEDSMDKLRTVVKKYKRRLNLPFLNFSLGDYGPGQEGNHRMALAAEMFGWNEKFPVLVVTSYLGD